MKRLIKANTMEVVYSNMELPNKVVKMIFLAGPSPRNNNVVSWRKEALNNLKEMGYDGTVFVPEPSSEHYADYEDQIGWEWEAMKRADVILFWVPRDLETLPAFTTNIEFGQWIDSGKVVFGFPEEAEKMRYLEALANKNVVACHHTLKDTLNDAIYKLGDGALRVDGECEVPLLVWNTKTFQNWYKAQKDVGNRLDHANLEYTFRVKQDKSMVFLWILHVDIYIKNENRNKTNELVISRTNTSYTVIYKKEKNIMNSKVVLVKEFRSASATDDGYIWELVGGSSTKEDEDELEVAASEIYEETGFVVNKNRIKYVQERQLNGTLTAHKTSLFSLEVNDEEIEWFEGEKGKVHGNTEESEYTYIEVLTLEDILKNELLDWSNVGMITKILMS